MPCDAQSHLINSTVFLFCVFMHIKKQHDVRTVIICDVCVECTHKSNWMCVAALFHNVNYILYVSLVQYVLLHIHGTRSGLIRHYTNLRESHMMTKNVSVDNVRENKKLLIGNQLNLNCNSEINILDTSSFILITPTK